MNQLLQAIGLPILDRYLIGKYLRTFFFTVLIFVLIGAVIDFSENVEKFIEEPITWEEIAIGYYPNFIFFLASMLWPLFTLIAVIFFTSRMAFNSEIISIFNAGIPFRRMLRPYLMCAALIAAMHLIGNHLLVPKGNKVRLDLVHTHIWRDNDKGKTENVHLFLTPDSKVYVHSFNKRDSTARKVRLERFRDGELIYMLKASSAVFLAPPNQWRIKDYQVRTFNGLEEKLVLHRAETLDTLLNFSPADFVDYKEQHQMMTSPELVHYINQQQQRGAGNTRKYQIELQRRSAEPVTIFILTIIGVAVAARKVRGGMGLHLAIGMGIGALFVFLSRFSTVIAAGQGIPIEVGIWMPNVLFGLIAFYLVRNAQK